MHQINQKLIKPQYLPTAPRLRATSRTCAAHQPPQADARKEIGTAAVIFSDIAFDIAFGIAIAIANTIVIDASMILFLLLSAALAASAPTGAAADRGPLACSSLDFCPVYCGNTQPIDPVDDKISQGTQVGSCAEQQRFILQHKPQTLPQTNSLASLLASWFTSQPPCAMEHARRPPTRRVSRRYPTTISAGPAL